MAGPTIYLFEDDDGLRALLVELLQEELAAQVVVSPNLAKLLQLSQREPPALIVADFWGTSHLQLSGEERSQIEALGALAPTILVSGRHWAQEAGPDELGLAGMVSKPIDVESFVAKLKDTLAVKDDVASDLPARDAMSVLVLPWAPPTP